MRNLHTISDRPTGIGIPTRRVVLPGTIRFGEASCREYAALARHHYRARPPATVAAAVAAWYEPPRVAGQPAAPPRLVAVAVLSWPVAMCAARNRHFGLRVGVPGAYGRALRFANANVRTVSRVVVHPQFRAIGLARGLVALLIARCPTRYVEASAAMGAFVGCFDAAGMTRVPTPPGGPAYFLIDKERLCHPERA